MDAHLENVTLVGQDRGSNVFVALLLYQLYDRSSSASSKQGRFLQRANRFRFYHCLIHTNFGKNGSDLVPGES